MASIDKKLPPIRTPVVNTVNNAMTDIWYRFFKTFSATSVTVPGDPGLITYTGTDFTARTITGTAGSITITNGGGVSGNPTVAISSSYPGQTSITILGTITTGVWVGTAIAAAGLNSNVVQTVTNDTNVTGSIAAQALTLGWTGTLAVTRGGIGTGSAGITAFNNITGYTAAGATGTTSTNLVFSTSPTLVTPVLGTPTSGTLTNCTGYTDANLATSDITTNNATSTKHGFLPKLSNVATQYLDGSGAFSVPSGKLLQTVIATTSTEGTTSTAIPYDDTIPQNTEGAECLTCTITPTSASSTLVIEFNGFFGAGAANQVIVALFQDSTASALRAVTSTTVGNDLLITVPLLHTMTSGTTSSTTFKIRYGLTTATAAYFLKSAVTGNLFGGVNIATLKISEITL